MNGFTTALGKYATFSGRSTRREYWGYTLTVWALAIIVAILYAAGGGPADLTNAGDVSIGALSIAALVLAGLMGLLLFIPTLALGWRRCQDVGIPGPVALLGLLVPLAVNIIGLIPGARGPNQYGPDPKG
ncbi:DUF805 domain-containing protein [Demequina pelophila]|uniref:DUF805 domain-containing protein n=1 Tax=Demequina pelophila TaxID=1638984 RepID=UPI000785A5DF|nr:DUF805 domain-containing protein [Demequina pelophila]